MTHVLTLIADPRRFSLDDTMLRMVREAINGLGNGLGGMALAPDWLAPSIACDLPFSDLPLDRVIETARNIIGGSPIDVVAQPIAGRRKAILVADMESTIIEQEMLDELGELVGARDRIAAITARAMNGEIDFKGALRERVALLSGLPATVLTDMIGRVTLMPGAETLLRTLKAQGVYCALVSGGFKTFTSHVRARIGFDEDQANDLVIADGKLTGAPVEPVQDKDSKRQALIRIAADRSLPLSATMTVGDGANDLPMLQAAGLGIAFRAKPSVAAAAPARIDYADLTALLYAQGYRQAEFASP